MTDSFTNSLSFSLPNSVTIVDKANNYPIIYINNDYAQAEIAINGAHVMHYQPKGQAPVLWLSEAAVFEKGHAIRGGIPLCWPWFGDHSNNPELPAHGFARNDSFELISITSNAQGETLIKLHLSNNTFNQAYWQEAFTLAVDITVGETLSVAMTMQNNSHSELPFSSALHSYFTISDVDNIVVKGLDQTAYFDKVKSFETGTQQGDILIDREIDRVYMPSNSPVSIIDKGLKRTLMITKSGSQSTVVWNPWIDKATAMSDFHNSGYRTMVCIETANALDDTIVLGRGESHTILTNISLEKH